MVLDDWTLREWWEVGTSEIAFFRLAIRSLMLFSGASIICQHWFMDPIQVGNWEES